MKEKLSYEHAEIEILPLSDVVTSSAAFDGEEDLISDW